MGNSTSPAGGPPVQAPPSELPSQHQDSETFEDFFIAALSRRGYDDQLRHGLGERARLPEDLIDLVFEYANVSRQVTRLARGAMQVHDGQVLQYVQFPIVDGPWMDRYKITSISITAASRDQGWSSYQEDHGTYRNSWTWSDITVTDLADQQEGERFEMEAYRNLHAHRHWQHHTCKAKGNHELLRATQRGKVVTLNVKARFPGWVHSIQSAGITVTFLQTYS